MINKKQDNTGTNLFLNKCFIAHSYDSPSQEILLSTCSKLLQKYNLEPWYASLHEDKYQAEQDIRYDSDTTPLDKIIEMIAHSRCGLYDLTMWKDKQGFHYAQNVFIELGISIGLNRPALLLYQDKTQCLPIPEILIGLDVLRFAGETTLTNELVKRLPKWVNNPPEQDWLNRYCYSGKRVCEFREEASSHSGLSKESVKFYIMDGDDSDKRDFRTAITEIMDKYSGISFSYGDDTLPIRKFDLQICLFCQTARDNSVSIYRLTENTPPEIFLSIGIDLAQEIQFKFKKPKIFISDSMEFVPSLLTKYQILEADNDIKLKKQLKIAIPEAKIKAQKIKWKPFELPFIDVIHSSNLMQSAETNPVYSFDQNQIFISYAWKGERKALINQLCQAFGDKGYQIFRDKSSMTYRNSIKNFMDSIGRGKFIILVISDKYMKSEYCMYEAYRMFQSAAFKERVFPIVLPDADVFSFRGQLAYLKYWKSEFEALEDEYKKIAIASPTMVAPLTERLRDIEATTLFINDFMSAVSDMNVLTSQTHLESNFDQLVAAIEERMKRIENGTQGSLTSTGFGSNNSVGRNFKSQVVNIQEDHKTNTDGGTFIGGGFTNNGTNISIGGSVSGANIVIGNNNTVSNITSTNNVFPKIYQAIEKSERSALEKEGLKAEYQEIESAVTKGQTVDESWLSRQLRYLKHIAPDIAEVALDALASPGAAVEAIVKQAAEKAIAEADS